MSDDAARDAIEEHDDLDLETTAEDAKELLDAGTSPPPPPPGDDDAPPRPA